ncbi:hypothetical protein D2V17_07855 [Aurantiacibacter xanthus]|uniref:Secreted protein n=1 Tax=Aurantiacibacter xanthus TaxID=1784712 RepID=A0A3A1P9D1_9SPHN|nr:hypothetical protein [Aurantiacibacter xanthus]RIV88254.1 hypothetical protein D2V17_07855 [Aurantiacibacter xanthus]
MKCKVLSATGAAALLALAGCSNDVPADEVEATIDQPDPDLREQVVDMPADPGTVQTRKKIEDQIKQDVADEVN